MVMVAALLDLLKIRTNLGNVCVPWPQAIPSEKALTASVMKVATIPCSSMRSVSPLTRATPHNWLLDCAARFTPTFPTQFSGPVMEASP